MSRLTSAATIIVTHQRICYHLPMSLPVVMRCCLIALLPALFAYGQQPSGSLSGRIVYVSAGHGWTYNNDEDAWYTQRGDWNEIIEDYGNLDQMNLFVAYCFNAGATVVPFRPVGYQTNEVVLDNVSPAVTFSGTWSTSAASSGYYGAGNSPYRFATSAATETSAASYVPTLLAAGFYPVYTWASHGTNRTSQLYRIRHTGGEAQVRVPHNMVGSGWIYLGTYYFNAGSNALNGAVLISNLRASPTSGGVVIVDAIRFGNGIGDVVPQSTGTGTPTISGYPREEECARYWVQRGVGVGAPSALYDGGSDDGSDNVSAPPRMAAHMNREDVGSMFKRIFVSFHSNGGGGAARGTLALHNGNHAGASTPNQLRLAQLIGNEVNDDLVAASPTFELPWHDRGSAVTLSRSDFAFGEIHNAYIDDEFDATILEVGFHDNIDDARLMRDFKVRNVAARATYQAIVRYMNEFDGVALTFLPEPPANVRALAAGPGRVQIQWDTPLGGGSAAAGYVVYGSTNGYGFGAIGGVRGGSSTFVTISNLIASDWYFRVAGTNAAGESLPSHVVGSLPAISGPQTALFVNGFDRIDRFLNVRQTAGPGIGGANGGTATFDRVKPRLMNSFDYAVQHGRALATFGVPFDSCENEAVAAEQVRLTNYAVLVWAAGQESTDTETFSAAEQARITNYLARGGKLLVSGAEIAWDLDRATGPTTADRAFLNNYLRADLGADTNDDAGTYNFAPTAGRIFAGNGSARFDDGSGGIYNVQYPDVLTPVGSQICLVYSGGRGNAAVQFADSSTGSRLVYLGFPFEAINTAIARERHMFDVLRFFEALPRPVILSVTGQFSGGAVTLSWSAVPGRRYRLQYNANIAATWVDVAGDITATNTTAFKTDSSAAGAQRFYRVVWVE